MKQLIITCCFIAFLCFPSLAQKNSEQFQKIEIAKVAYITKRLELSQSEAQKFFPIYNEYRKEMRAIVREKHNHSADKKKHSRNELEFDSDVLACKKKYRERFKEAVPESKASQFFEVEREFREQLFKELQSRNRK